MQFAPFGVKGAGQVDGATHALGLGHGEKRGGVGLRAWRGRRAQLGGGQVPAVGHLAQGTAARCVLAFDAVHRGQLFFGLRYRFAQPLVLGLAAHAQQALLQVTVGSQRFCIHGAVDAPVDHDGHPVSNRGGHADVLLYQQNRHLAFLAQGVEQFLHLFDDDRCQTFGWLVHDEQSRVAQQRARNGQHLLLASRKLRAAVVAPLGQARKYLVHPVYRPAGILLIACHQAQMFVNGQARPDASALRHIAYAQAMDFMGFQGV